MKKEEYTSQIYFRAKNETTGKFEPITFEDLTMEQQIEEMKGRSTEWLQNLALQLAFCVRVFGNEINDLKK
jgi:hypothetical protein